MSYPGGGRWLFLCLELGRELLLAGVVPLELHAEDNNLLEDLQSAECHKTKTFRHQAVVFNLEEEKNSERLRKDGFAVAEARH